ncbi:uncharacterized protein LOC143056970 [Mytilus galloprovincialis]|uniref:uncharacterized protein LOC143056970 n=1 Tax=Mytilus galloprovincialis TaxID=29158 RepID=UPI003F7C1B7D
MAAQLVIRPLKACNNTREQRKGIVCSTTGYEEFLNTCCAKFEVEAIVCVVLEEDGTEVDAAYFSLLPQNTNLMILCPGQTWQKDTPQSSTTPSDERINPRLMSYIEKCRTTSRVSTAEKKTTSGSRTKAVIIGWQHFSYSINKYVLMKNSTKHFNIGPRPIQMNKCLTQNQVLQEMVHIFFPNGKNFKGKLHRMEYFLGNYKGEGAVFTQLVEYGKDKPHLYLHTKEKIPKFEVQSGSDSQDSDIELPALSTSRNSPQNATPSSSQTYQLQYTTMTPPASNQYSMLTPPASNQYSMLNPPVSNQYSMLTPSASNQYSTLTTQASTHVSPADWIQLDTPTVSVSKDFMHRSITTHDDNSQRCTVCVDRPKTAVIIPCGHTFCMACATQIEALDQPCPVCRTAIQDVNQCFP